MAEIHRLLISPPLINSSCVWASDFDQILELYKSPYTSAVTTRTATLGGFEEYASHTMAFHKDSITSINSYGYSPHPLTYYLDAVMRVFRAHPGSSKPFIVSITSSSPDTLSTMLIAIQAFRFSLADHKAELSRIAIEFNCSCPNIKDAPPPAYSMELLHPLLQSLAEAHEEDPTLTIGLKLPPYTYATQFQEVVEEVSKFSTGGSNPFKFFTCTNTLGNSILFGDQTTTENQGFALPNGFGGLAGESLHALSLGNVHSFRKLLDESYDDEVRRIAIIGVGGVTTPAAVARMRQVGANVVGSATLLGKEGVKAFEILSQ